MNARSYQVHTASGCAMALACPSVDRIPLLDAAINLVVSVLVCLRVLRLLG